MRFDPDVPVPMDDGLVLRADVFRPPGAGRHPVILSMGPYGKGLHFEDLYTDQWRRMLAEHPDVAAGSTNAYQNWEVVDPEKWVPDGYACVRVDSRGAGRSPGLLDVWSAREARDLYACVEWAAAQPWSTGSIGMFGKSYSGFNAIQMAMLRPPALKAIVPSPVQSAKSGARKVVFSPVMTCSASTAWGGILPTGTVSEKSRSGATRSSRIVLGVVSFFVDRRAIRRKDEEKRSHVSAEAAASQGGLSGIRWGCAVYYFLPVLVESHVQRLRSATPAFG